MSGPRRRPPPRRPPPRRGRVADDTAVYEGEHTPYEDDDYGREQPRVRRERGTGGLFSPVRVLLALLAIGAGAAALYGMFLDRTILQMPITVSGLAVLGFALALLALSSARGAASLGRRGHGGKALVAALFGGLCAVGASGSLAGALVLGMLAASA